MTMVVVHQRNVFRSRTRVYEALHVFEEPRFVVLSNLVEQSWGAAVSHVAGHDDSSVLAEHDGLHKHVTVPHLQLTVQGLQHLLHGVHGDVVQPHKPEIRLILICSCSLLGSQTCEKE